MQRIIVSKRTILLIAMAGHLLLPGCHTMADPDKEDASPEDFCENTECGPALNAFNVNCGTCSGATDWCNAGTCEDDCLGLECGVSPNAGIECGSCGGDTPHCVEQVCVDGSPIWIAIPGGSFDMGSTAYSDEQPDCQWCAYNERQYAA